MVRRRRTTPRRKGARSTAPSRAGCALRRARPRTGGAGTDSPGVYGATAGRSAGSGRSGVGVETVGSVFDGMRTNDGGAGWGGGPPRGRVVATRDNDEIEHPSLTPPPQL